MKREIPDIDIILQVLKLCLDAQPNSVFVNSLLQQYKQRGSLSKKQLEGLHSKASKIKDFPVAKLATLQAIILKKHTKQRSEITVVHQKEIIPDDSPKQVSEILKKYPAHKRVLYFKMICDKAETLSPSDKTELERFYKLLVKA